MSSAPKSTGTSKEKIIYFSQCLLQFHSKIDQCFHSNRSDMAGLSRKEIIESVRHSLMNLGMAYIDLVIIHKSDPNCPMEGT